MPFKRWWVALLTGILLIPACTPKPQVTWEKYTPQAVEEAVYAGRPIVLYFYAAWCATCYQMKDQTFSDPRVIAGLEPFRRFKVDMSFQHAESVKALGAQFRVEGVPMLLFLIPENGQVNPYRIRGFVSADRLLEIIRRLNLPAVGTPTPGTSPAGISENAAGPLVSSEELPLGE